MKVTVIGLGYLGLVHAATLAEMGNKVLGIDINTDKVQSIQAGQLPFYEPQLDELVKKHVKTGDLQFTTNMSEVSKFANAHFLCVGTPLTSTGQTDLHYLFDAVESLVSHFKGPENLIIGKSTAPPGTAQKLLETARQHYTGYVDVAWNPEFLRAGLAVNDSLFPSRLVFGVNNHRAELELRQIYAHLLRTHCQPLVTDVFTSEMAKLASNAFLATKISFINGIAQYCEANSGNVRDITRIIGSDSRIGMVGLQPGLGFGGGCLPKDTQMLTYLADENHARKLGRLLRFTQVINHSRTEQVIDLADKLLLGFHDRNIGILGASFKPGTDDTRESPGLILAEVFRDQGAHVIIHDPHVTEHDNFTFLRHPQDVLLSSDLTILATDHPEYGKLDPPRLNEETKYLIDGRYSLNRKKWTDAGWEYHEVGK